MIRPLIDTSEILAPILNALDVMLSKLCKQCARESWEQASHDRVGSARQRMRSKVSVRLRVCPFKILWKSA